MPDVVGELIVAAVVATGEGEAFAAGAEATYLGISGITAIGSATILAASIGLQYALNNPDVPRPENGAIPLKQGIKSRVRGYWINRLSGPYLLYVPAGGDSQDMIAFHSGRIESVIQVYLHDQPVALVPDPNDGIITTVQVVGAHQFNGPINIQIFYGTDTQNSSSLLNSGNTSGTWTTDYAAKGIACLAMYCATTATPSDFTQVYPQGLPLPSVVAKCSPVWDPRDGSQTRADRLTWRASANPVLQLINYLTETDGGMGLDFDTILPTDVLAQWMAEADLCNGLYESAGFYQFDNSPENVIGKILSTCDGWLSEAGDGTLALTVGVYRAPTEDPITEEYILGFSVKYGMADEETVNQLDVTYTNPSAGYVSDQIDSVRDEDSISLTGMVRARPLDLSWVQDEGQAALLAQRARLRINPAISGTLVTTLYGQRYLGKRWVKLQIPTSIVRGLEDCVVEIQDRAEVDILGGTVTFTWNLVDDETLTLLDQAVLRRETTAALYRREDDTLYVRES